MWDSPSAVPQGCLVRAGQEELPGLGFPSLPQPSQNHSLHLLEKGSCLSGRVPQAEPGSKGEKLPFHAHSPAGCLLWEHFLGDGIGSMLACKSGLTMPSPELPAGGCGAPQSQRELLSVPAALVKRSRTRIPQPHPTKPWGAEWVRKCELRHPAP